MSPDETAQALKAASAEPSGDVLSAESAVGAAASMAAASPQSSVASVADLASITPVELASPAAPAQIPTELLAVANGEMTPGEPIAARAEASEA